MDRTVPESVRDAPDDDETPDQYQPDNLGERQVGEVQRGHRRVSVPRAAIVYLGADVGDHLVFEEDGDAVRVTVREADDE